MTGSAATKRVNTKPTLDDYYRWDEPDSDITICLQPETVDRLQSDVLRGIDSSPRVGNEVGGILLGRCDPDAGRNLIVVDEFEPVHCEHRHGPHYTLSDDDATLFEAALAWGKTRREHRVVGYYRSHCRQGLFLSADDLRIIQRHFPGPDNLFLLIKALPNRACTAGFFFWKDGHIQSEFTDSEVPLIPISLSLEDEGPLRGEGSGEIRVEPPVPALSSTGQRITMPSLGSARSRARSPRLTGGLVLSGVALAATVALISHRDPQPLHGGSAAETPRVVRNVESAAPSAMRAASGTAKQSVPTISRDPKTVDLPGRSETQTTAPSNTTPATPTPAGETVVPVAPVTLDPGIAPSVKAPAVTADLPLNTVPLPSAETTIVQTTPAIPPRLPDNQVTLPTAPARLDTGNTTPRIDTGTAPPPQVLVSQPSRRSIGPQVIHQVSPAVPRGVGPRITTDVEVDVEVAIDAKGKATGARIASTKGAAAELLTIEALKAAQLFRFTPAQENGRNVASTMVLTFRFDRTAK